jgi:adenosine deaminase
MTAERAQFSEELLKRLPKPDLHLHLDGSLRL